MKWDVDADVLRRAGMVPAAPPAGHRVGSLQSDLEATERLSSLRSSMSYPPSPSRPAPEAFDGLAGEIVRAIEPHTEADPAAILLQLLVGFGNVVGRGPHFVVERDRHHTNLFACVVGVTSKGRKGTSWGWVRWMLEQADPAWAKERIKSGLVSGEGLIWHVRDGDVADRRLLALEPEFASVLRSASRDGNVLSATVRQAWDRGDLMTLAKTNPVEAHDAHVSCIGHITADELRRELVSTEIANGFANRILFAWSRRSKVLPHGGALQEGDLEELVELLRHVVATAKQRRRLTRTADARRVWEAVYEPLSTGRPGLLGAVLGRAEAQVGRLEMVYALLDGAAETNPKHLLAAIAFWEYCAASAAQIFGNATGDPVADQILAALRRTEALTRTQIRDLFQRNQDKQRIDAALSLLELAGCASMIPDYGTGGRPAERWSAVGPPTTETTLTTEGGPLLGLARRAIAAQEWGGRGGREA